MHRGRIVLHKYFKLMVPDVGYMTEIKKLLEDKRIREPINRMNTLLRRFFCWSGLVFRK